MRSKMSFVSLFVPGLFLVAGCPSAGDMDGDMPGGVSESSVSNAERAATIEHVGQMIDPIKLNGDPAVTDQVVALLSGMPDFDLVKAYAGSVVARFTDGEVLVVVNTRPPDDLDTSSQATISKPITRERAAGLSPLAQAVYRRQGATNVTALPASKKVVLINAMGTAFADDTPQLRDWFNQAKYDVTVGDGTIEDFQNIVKDVGVLYVSSHGAPIPDSALTDLYKDVLEGVGETPRPTVPLEDSDGNDHFFLWTRTEINDQTIEKYRLQVRQGQLAYMFAENNRPPGGPSTQGRHFCVTERFVHDNWTCQPNALVYMDCCWSASSLLSNVCVYSPVNASIFVGWSASTYDPWSVPSERYFFDRMLGINSYLPTHPPQRPRSVTDVEAAMRSRIREKVGLPLNQSQTSKTAHARGIAFAELTFIYSVQDLLFRPAIESVATGQAGQQKTVVLTGAFGDEQGAVTADGTLLPAIDWKTNQITCSSPGSGPGSKGRTVVQAGDRESNPRALTQWNLTLRRLFMDFPTQAATDCPSCFYEATLHFTFRADVGPVRTVVDGDLAPKNATGAADEGDIDVTNAGGSYSIGQGSTITLAPNSNDGAKLIGTCTGFLPPLDNNYLGACFLVRGDQNQIAFSPTLFAEGLFRDYTGGQFDGIIDSYQVVYSGNIVGNELILSLSPNFNITAGHQVTGANSYFDWDGADAISPPDTNDPK